MAASKHPDARTLRNLARSRDGVRLYEDVHDVARLMADARLAVTSGGTTVWELALLGVPAIVGSVAPIEERLVAGLRAQQLFDVLGSYQQISPGELARRVRARLSDADWITRMAHLARKIVDGEGRRRVVDAMEDRS